jgi:tRNA/tmRNA/rRNA uracil-C5-methylase (TrmA/RlmC/RlmD family)
MDFRVLGGRAALGRPRSKDTVALDECHLLHPGLVEVFDRLGDLTGVDRITLRIAEASGDRLVIIDGKVPDHAASWGVAVGRREGREVVGVIGEPILRHAIGDDVFRVSGSAFFQVNTAGAATLADLVVEALDADGDDVLLDAYAGGGLFAVIAGRGAGSVLAIERHDAATRDLRHNLESGGIDVYEVLQGDTRRILRSMDAEVDLAIVDPPRSGLGAEVVTALAEWSPRVVAYVSCDPASLARDARELTKAGYAFEWATPVDLFPQTHHVETVARFTR